MVQNAKERKRLHRCWQHHHSQTNCVSCTTVT